jgi:hypothetical protein
LTPDTWTPLAPSDWKERLEDLVARLRTVDGFPEELITFLELAASIEPGDLAERREVLEQAAAELDDLGLALGLSDLGEIQEFHLAAGLEEYAAGFGVLLEVLRARHVADQALAEDLPEVYGRPWRDELREAGEFFARDLEDPAIGRVLEALSDLAPEELGGAAEEGSDLRQVLAELEAEQLPGLILLAVAIGADPRFRAPESAIALNLLREAVRAELAARQGAA